MIARGKSLTAQVFDALLEDIVMGHRASGTMLSEKAVAEEFGISKSPVREAFVQLQTLGLVDVIPQRGCLVFKPAFKEVQELCEMRVVLECEAMRRAMAQDQKGALADLKNLYEKMSKLTEPADRTGRFGHLDEDFHKVFFDHAGNEALNEAHRLFAPRIQALRTNLQSQDGYLLEKAQEDHLAIISAFEASDHLAASAAIRVHAERMIDKYETEEVRLTNLSG